MLRFLALFVGLALAATNFAGVCSSAIVKGGPCTSVSSGGFPCLLCDSGGSSIAVQGDTYYCTTCGDSGVCTLGANFSCFISGTNSQWLLFAVGAGKGVESLNRTGPAGASGTTGATGTTGSAGTTGATGTNGADGANGATGATGADGADGANGANGATGATGGQGSSGATGGHGTSGTTGAQGLDGVGGTSGVTGATGATGARGWTGAQGETGVTGAQGENGASGATGATGAQGADGNGANGASGGSGSSGATGPTGSTGARGATGATGSTGALGPSGTTGADGGIDAPVAPWLNLTAGYSVFFPSIGQDPYFPACFPDSNGQVYLRGHLSLSPVPAVGGIVLGLFPKDAAGKCACTPEPEHTVIATTTALAYPTANPDVAEVCIVRLLISFYLPPDVNRDLVVNVTDQILVNTSVYYNLDPTEDSKCPLVDGKHTCGPADVNQDGKVNILDYNSIEQSLSVVPPGVQVPCGGVYATAFSCGSTKETPLTPAVSISLDSIMYFNDNGVVGSVYQPAKRFQRGDALTNSILAQLDKVNVMAKEVEKVSDLEARLVDVNSRLEANVKKVNSSFSPNHIVSEVLVSAGVILVAAALVVAWKRTK
jgi:hypothetical protein